ncbi:hypothetical protein EDD86DRAFT_45981 [Gorgonomyces haynaldii]|nr:hypothetical protein EDD86DRAFT_45981 [Gorgonomyces haynaldii]
MAGAAAVGVGAAALASAGSSKEKQLPYGSDVQYGVIGGGSALVAGQVEESKTVVSVSDMDIPEDSVVPEETQKLRQMASLSSMAPSDQVLQEEILTRKIITATTKTTTTEKVVGVAAGAVAVGAAASSVGSKKGYTVITNQSLDEEEEDLSSYHPPAPTSHVVTTSYFPIRSDEMLLQTGDLIGIEKEYSDGWARGQNISQGRKRCIFPMAVVTPIKSGPSQTVVRGNRWQGQSTPETNPLASTKIPQRTTSIRRRIKKKTSTATISTSASD